MPITPVEPTAAYDYTQDELYSISDTMYQNLADDIADFFGLKPTKYVAGFLTAVTGRRTAAVMLPDAVQTSSLHESDREALKVLRDVCVDKFIVLKSYIKDGFPKNVRKIKNDEAGQTVYR